MVFVLSLNVSAGKSIVESPPHVADEWRNDPLGETFFDVRSTVVFGLAVDELHVLVLRFIDPRKPGDVCMLSLELVLDTDWELSMVIDVLMVEADKLRLVSFVDDESVKKIY